MMIPSIIESTQSADSLESFWDAIVIGAGPAGCVAALQLSRSNFRTLLLDKAEFPRNKVCGSCLNASVSDALAELDLSDLLSSCSAVPLRSLVLCEKSDRVEINLERSFALSRKFFDSELLIAAIRSGTEFLAAHMATVSALNDDYAALLLSGSEREIELRTKIVIVADGLAGHSLDKFPQFAPVISYGSRIAASTIVSSAVEEIERGKIYMSCAPNGYTGMVILEDGQLDVASALDLDFSKQQGGPSQASSAILASCKFTPRQDLGGTHWQGTDSLTRSRRSVAGKRLLIVGDSASYVEPFTGEGIGWALWSAFAASGIAKEGISRWDDSLISKWQRIQYELIRKKQDRCKIIAAVLRNNCLRHAALSLLSITPRLANPFLPLLNGSSFRKEIMQK